VQCSLCLFTEERASQREGWSQDFQLAESGGGLRGGVVSWKTGRTGQHGSPKLSSTFTTFFFFPSQYWDLSSALHFYTSCCVKMLE
jgi:hypothetical protein